MVSIEAINSDEKKLRSGHIRPKLRKKTTRTRKVESSNTVPASSSSSNSSTVDDLIEQTRLKMSSALITASNECSDITATLSSINNTGSSAENVTQTQRANPQEAAPEASTSTSTSTTKPKGILKKSTQKPRQRDLENDSLADELGISVGTESHHTTKEDDSGNWEKPSTAPFVKDQVVERSVKDWSKSKSKSKNSVKIKDTVHVQKASDEITISNSEGALQPEKEATAATGDRKISSAPPTSTQNLDNEPKVIKSLAELVSFANELKDQNQASNQKKSESTKMNKDNDISAGMSDLDDSTKNPLDETSVLEADLEFTCMSAQEYDAMLKESETSETFKENDTEGDEEPDTENTDGFLDDSDAGNEDDSDDEGGLFDFFGGGDDDSLVEEALPPPPLRPFMVLWNALSGWITAEAVAVLRKHKSELFSSNGKEGVILETKGDGTDMHIGTSDIDASRCAGLMTMLKMNLVKALSESGYNSEDGYTRRIAENRLSEFVQCFDFSRSMVKFDMKMYRALTIVLVSIVLPRHDIAYEGEAGIIVKDEPSDEIPFPSPLHEIGVTEEEFKYLVNRAIPTLDIGSDL